MQKSKLLPTCCFWWMQTEPIKLWVFENIQQRKRHNYPLTLANKYFQRGWKSNRFATWNPRVMTGHCSLRKCWSGWSVSMSKAGLSDNLKLQQKIKNQLGNIQIVHYHSFVSKFSDLENSWNVQFFRVDIRPFVWTS